MEAGNADTQNLACGLNLIIPICRMGGVREGTPIDGIVFLFGVSLGVPIYGGIIYAALTLTDKSKK